MTGWLRRLLTPRAPFRKDRISDGVYRPASLTLPKTLMVDDMRKVLQFKPKVRGEK